MLDLNNLSISKLKVIVLNSIFTRIGSKELAMTNI